MASSIALSLHRKYSLISHSSNKKTTFFFVHLPQKIERCSEFHQRRSSRKAKRVSTRVLGLQHQALMSEDIFRMLREMREMRKRSSVGGFEFTPSPLPTPYQNLKAQVGDMLMNKQIKEELINDPVVKAIDQRNRGRPEGCQEWWADISSSIQTHCPISMIEIN